MLSRLFRQLADSTFDSARIDWLFVVQEEEQKLPTSENSGVPLVEGQKGFRT
jgi:hypothetical protein